MWSHARKWILKMGMPAGYRRFRERQKGLITALKSKADTLAKQVEEQKKTIEDLRNDKQTLQTLLEAKQEPE